MILNLIEEKSPRDKDGDTPFHEAAKNGHVEIVKIFLDVVVDKNPKNNCNTTPLHEAASSGHKESVKFS